jgi:hypothetical protein
MIADVAGFVACDDAADRVPLPGGLVVVPILRGVRSNPYASIVLEARPMFAMDCSHRP